MVAVGAWGWMLHSLVIVGVEKKTTCRVESVLHSWYSRAGERTSRVGPGFEVVGARGVGGWRGVESWGAAERAGPSGGGDGPWLKRDKDAPSYIM